MSRNLLAVDPDDGRWLMGAGALGVPAGVDSPVHRAAPGPSSARWSAWSRTGAARPSPTAAPGRPWALHLADRVLLVAVYWRTNLVRGFAELVSDLVAEVVSPSDRASEVVGKALAWLDAGVRVVWVVDPESRTVTVYRHDTATVLRGGDVLGDELLPGFALPLDELWAG